jgi:UDP-N-acetylglucosamine--N-acetylmuramyl-(pentapeptide) pyrophosphoryl-undecaprenol N-acetylglucosamine transferase
VADELRKRGVTIEFVGSTSGIEVSLVREAGYRLHALPLMGLSGNPMRRARAGFLFLKAMRRCHAVLESFRPGVVLGVGGYASAPSLIAATLLKIPTVLHEQNSVPGRVNRFASHFTRETFVTFPEAAHSLKNAVPVGMPTRSEFFDTSKEEALRRLGLDPPVVLLFGGSGGALKLNLAASEAFQHTTPYSILHISGRRDFERLSTKNPRYRIIPYEDELWYPLAAADLVIMRAGAGSLFDVAAAGRPAILIPYPYATGDHQIHNARHFTDRNAAEILLDDAITATLLRARVEDLLADESRREKLAKSMRTLATPEAADEVAGRLLEAAVREKGERR